MQEGAIPSQVTRSGNQAERFEGGGSPASHLFLFQKMPPGPLGGPCLLPPPLPRLHGFTRPPLMLNQAGLGIWWLQKQ